jgi:hypothetical protein
MSVITGNFGSQAAVEVNQIDASDALDAFINYLDGADAEVAVAAYLPELGRVVVGSNMRSTDSTLTILEMGRHHILTALLEGGEDSHTHLYMDVEEGYDDEE